MKKVLALAIIMSCIFSVGCGDKTNSPTETSSTENLSIAILSYDILNPILTKSESAKQMLNLVFEPLFLCDNSLEPITILAESYWLDGTGLVCNIKLKENVKFSDGSILTSKDVLYSYDIAKSSGVYKNVFDNISTVEAQGKNIKITLKNVQPKFVNLLEIPIIKENSNENPIGTGAYKIAEISRKQIDLIENIFWWNDKKPHIKNVKVQILPNNSSIFYSFANKETNVFFTTPDMPDNQSTGNGIHKQIPTNSFTFLMLNNEIIKDANFKQAISLSINRENFINSIFGGQATATCSFLNPNWSIYSSNAKGYDYNLQKAKNIMKDYNDISSFPIMVNEDNEQRVAVAEAIVKNMKDAGMNVWLYKVKWEEYQSKIASRDFTAFIGEINLDNSANVSQFIGENNLGKFSSQKMKSTIEVWQNQTSILGQDSGFYYAQEAYLEDMPFVSLYYRNKFVLYSKGLSSENDFTPLVSNIFYGINYWKKEV